jgi:hypothetical protein
MSLEELPHLTVSVLTPLLVTENTTVVVGGGLLHMASDVRLRGLSVPFTLYNNNGSNGTRRLLVESPTWLEFMVPAMTINATTETLPVEIVACNRQCQVQSAQVILLYSASPCEAGELEIDAGAVMHSERCGPCPSGGYCPGGSVVWPLAGYWSVNEFTAPSACAFASACPGVNLALEGGDGAKVDVSTCAAGYMGSYCSACDDAYYSDGYSCRACVDSVVSNHWHALVAMVVIFGAMGLCCALLPLGALTKTVALFLDAQLLFIILSAATPYINKPQGLGNVFEVHYML